MAVDTKHKDYERNSAKWKKIRDLVEGQEAVHQGGETYLPRLDGMSGSDYEAYVARTPLYNATARTLDGLVGLIFRKDPQVDAPPGMSDFLEDVTLDGKDFVEFARSLTADVLSVNRAGVLVDFPRTNPGETMSVAQAAAAGRRPFMRHYKAEDVLHWETSLIGTRTMLSHVRLREEVDEPDPSDEFEGTCVEQIRVLDFLKVEGVQAPQYRQRIFRKNEKGEWFLFDEIFPRLNGKTLSFIPFKFFSTKDTTPAVKKPTLLDLTNLNIAHYQVSADLRHGAHFTALPTPVIIGQTFEDDAVIKIGSTTALVLPAEGADAKYLEFQGSGLGTCEKLLDRYENQMAAVGARMLAPEKRQVETAETAQIHRHGENSVLASAAGSISSGLTWCLEVVREWMAVAGDAVCELNRDFVATPMDPQMLAELFRVYQGGGMAFEDFVDKLKKGEIIREDRDIDELRADIETEKPPALPQPGGITDPAIDDEEEEETPPVE